jgi:hypothetical protein
MSISSPYSSHDHMFLQWNFKQPYASWFLQSICKKRPYWWQKTDVDFRGLFCVGICCSESGKGKSGTSWWVEPVRYFHLCFGKRTIITMWWVMQLCTKYWNILCLNVTELYIHIHHEKTLVNIVVPTISRFYEVYAVWRFYRYAQIGRTSVHENNGIIPIPSPPCLSKISTSSHLETGLHVLRCLYKKCCYIIIYWLKWDQCSGIYWMHCIAVIRCWE